MELSRMDWKEVFDELHNDLIISDADGIVIYANKATEELYGDSLDALIGKSVEDLENNKVFYPSITRRVLKKRKKETLIQETRVGKKVLVTGVPILNSDGSIKHVVSYSHDVTELVRLRDYVNKIEEEMVKVKCQLEKLKKERQPQAEIIAASPAMKKVLVSAEKVAEFDVTVLLTGESGVGKNVLAQWIHQNSTRMDKPLVEINCGSIPETLLESELFGYEPGSFSGAHQQGKKGLVEQAEGGTLFLDEIGELPLNLQVKLLTLIQEKKFYRVGGTAPRQVDFRLVAATNVDLKQKVKEGKFREDLYFRLSVVPIHIPPLRERPDDLFPLIHQFAQHYKTKYGLERRFNKRALEALGRYDWPGNVRELQHMVERLILTADGPAISIHDLPEPIFSESSDVWAERKGKSLPEMLDEFEGHVIKNAYAKCRNSVKLAEYLGISQPTANRKIQKYIEKGPLTKQG